MMLLACLLGFFALSSAQIREQGSCPQPKAISNFDESKLIGRWFEWGRVDNFYEQDHACGVIRHYRGNDGYIVESVNSIIRTPGTWTFWEGRMIPREERPTALYHLTFPDYALDPGLNSTYVAANWDHWVILHSCKEEGNQSLQFVWVWARRTTLNKKYQRQIAQALEKINFSIRNLLIVDHKNCPNHKVTLNELRKMFGVQRC
ncbi:apolipoprotein D [Fopius arisanus]|uniref:Apod_0 protein n=1 Tax=Fopius arisanus TaxID=64838 RepID=A0A0C9QNH6_9HYME|nr:PREDICTED: apolipoprotein D-like [Fopius arisanus]